MSRSMVQEVLAPVSGDGMQVVIQLSNPPTRARR